MCLEAQKASVNLIRLIQATILSLVLGLFRVFHTLPLLLLPVHAFLSSQFSERPTITNNHVYFAIKSEMVSYYSSRNYLLPHCVPFTQFRPFYLAPSISLYNRLSVMSNKLNNEKCMLDCITERNRKQKESTVLLLKHAIRMQTQLCF